MKLRLRAIGTGVALTSLVVGLAVAMSGTASATSPLPHDPANEFGTLSFYDAAGTKVTHGLIADDPFAKYVVTSADDPITTNTKATLYGYLPVNGTAPGSWSGEALSASTTFPVVGGPTVVSSAGTHRPVVTDNAGDTTLAGLAADFPNAAVDSYAGMYQLRVKTAGNTKYWVADIHIDTNAGTWSQVYPDVVATATSTALTAFPPSPAYVGESVTLTATVSPATAGTVQFRDGASALGAPVAVAAGQAQTTTSALAQGTHSLTAEFTPTDTASFASSTSAALGYTVNAVGAPTWRPVLAGAHKLGLTDSCLASFTGSPTLTYAWYVNGSPVGGATAATYKIAEAYYGKSLTCRVTATNASGSQTALSAPATVAVGPALVPTVKPTLSGTHHYGTYETCNHGTWSPAATSYSYQWYVGTSAISGATSYRYLMPKGYYGKTLSCVVTAKRLHWTNGVYRTAAVKIT